MSHRILAVAAAGLSVMALACAGKPLPSRSPLSVSPIQMRSGEWRVTDQVMVVLDASGTMYENETFPEAKQLAQSFVAAMPRSDVRAKRGGSYNAGFIGFGGSERATAPLATFNRSTLASRSQGTQIMGSVEGRGGETPYRRVFEEIAAELRGKSGQAAVVMFSDGLPDTTYFSRASARKLVDSYPDQICFYGVQTGDDPAGRAFFESLIALTNCGNVRSASSVASAGSLQNFVREVFVGEAPPPPPKPQLSTADPCDDVVRLRGVNFAFDKSEITPSSAVILDVAVDRLKQCTGVRVQIQGHTDAIGTDAYNQGLSERRAGAVQGYFVNKGISSRRLTTRGFGESQPIATNSTSEGRAQNRRVELVPSR